ncbi:ABC transporter permease [Chitinophagales bacterium]|nr:ABC transporter permease [Chitinophagales bacterium]
MWNYFLRRFVYGVLVLFGVVIIIFLMFKVMPDPSRMTMGQRADQASLDAVKERYHLDKSVGQQLVLYLNDLSPISLYEHTEANEKEYAYTHLASLGSKSLVAKMPYLNRSMQTNKRVTAVIWEALPTTMILGITAITIATILGIFFGIIASLNPFTWIDNTILASTTLGISQPSYFSGVVLGLVFGYWLSDWTGLTTSGPLFDLEGLDDKWVFKPKHLILPAIALGIRPISIIVMLTRATMLEVLSQDYIRTAKAKGLSNNVVVFKHALRNALNPVVTTVSGWFASVLAGAFFIEIIFDCKGLGFETVTALNNIDLPVVMGSVLFIAALFVTVNLFVDMIYGFLDPRVSYE